MSAPIIPRSSHAGLFERDTLEDIDEFEDTQPSVLLPDEMIDEDFGEAPTVPVFRVRSDGSVERHRESAALVRDDGQWDRVLRAVAVAVKRVFASHSIHSIS